MFDLVQSNQRVGRTFLSLLQTFRVLEHAAFMKYFHDASISLNYLTKYYLGASLFTDMFTLA